MDIGAAAQWAGIGILAIVQLTALVKSSRKGAFMEGASKNEFDNLKKEVSDLAEYVKSDKYGLPAIRRDWNNCRQHCGETSSRYDERIKAVERKVL